MNRLTAFPATALAAGLAFASLPAQAQTAFEATLAGHAALPAPTRIMPPKDAPASLMTSGKYMGPPGQRVDKLESVRGASYISDRDAPRYSDGSVPIKGQPVQGFSGIKTMKDGTFLVTSDNGFGSRANSPDAMLMFHRVKPDWKSGKVQRLSTLFLHDPDRKVPFLIVNEGTTRRYLTGADFDIESIQIVGDNLWFGDELGPYLIRTDMKGRVISVHDTKVDGRVARSPDHYTVSTPATPGAFSTPVRRSRGFEGMAASKDGKFLYPLLEGPLWDEQAKDWQKKDGREYVLILEFDVARGDYTGRQWKYLLEVNGNNIGDFNMIDATTGLIIERDNGEGDIETACNGPARPDCQNIPAKFKRVYKVDLGQPDADGFVRKIGYIDLLNIRDPDGRAHWGAKNGRFTFPLVTIENVDVVDADHIVVGNDNNWPVSTGRELGKNDHNELILLRVPEFLRAR